MVRILPTGDQPVEKFLWTVADTRSTIDPFSAHDLNGGNVLTRYKHLAFKKGSLAELTPARRERKLTPRQQAQLERDGEIKNAINEAAALPVSEWAGFEPKADQKIATLRAAVTRILRDEPRNINFAVRGSTFIFSKGPIPGGRGIRRRSGN